MLSSIFLRIIPNKVIALLTLSDIFTWGLLNVLNSLISIYLADKLGADTIRFVGTGMAIYLLASAITQIPLGLITDLIKKDYDEIFLLLIGNILMGLPFVLLPTINSPYHYYVLQAILGVGAACNLVNWRKLFAENLDSHKQGREYANYGALMNTATAAFSFLAGVIANVNRDYFSWVIVGLGTLMILSSLIVSFLFSIKNRKSLTV